MSTLRSHDLAHGATETAAATASLVKQVEGWLIDALLLSAALIFAIFTFRNTTNKF